MTCVIQVKQMARNFVGNTTIQTCRVYETTR